MITEKEIADQYSEMTLPQMVDELFRMLDTVEESDSGHVFHPTTISSVRVVDCMRLNHLLPMLKAAAQSTK